MSQSTLQSIWPGDKHGKIAEYANSWGTAPIVWGVICTRHLGADENSWLAFAASDNNRELWDCWKRADIPKSTRAALLFTYDHVYVQKKNYRRFAKDLRTFLEGARISCNRVNHWPWIAQQFEMEQNCPAMALWCTSVTSDPWNGPYNEEKGDYDPFDWERAGELYEILDSVDVAQKVSI